MKKTKPAGASVSSNVRIVHRSAAGIIKREWKLHNDFVAAGVTWATSRWRGSGTNSSLTANNNMFVQFGTGTRTTSFTQVDRNQATTTRANNRITAEAVYNYTSSSTVIDFLRLQVGTLVVADTGVSIASPDPGDSISVEWDVDFDYRDNTAAPNVDTSVINSVRDSAGGTDLGPSHFGVEISDIEAAWASICYTGTGTQSNLSFGRLTLYNPTGQPPPLPDKDNQVDLLFYEAPTASATFATDTLSYTFSVSWPATGTQSGGQRYRWWKMELSDSASGTFITCANGVWAEALTLPQVAVTGNVIASVTYAGST